MKRKRDWFLNEVMKTHIAPNGEAIVGCEVGTGSGNTMRNIMPSNPNLFLIQVAWYPKIEDANFKHSNYNGPKAKREWKEAIQPYLERMKILEMPSNLAVHCVKDESLDWVFIDADHSYESVKEDIKIWYPKVKKGGLVAGHDYNPELERLAGVIKAVDEYFGENFEVYEPDHVWYHWKKQDND